MTRLLLHCDVVSSKFTLGKQGEDWRQEFPDLRQALEHAAEMVSHETPISIYNELGKLIIESVITPRRIR